MAEILADEGIYAKVDPDVWAEALSGLLDRAKAGDIAGAYVFAVESCGDILAQHFPKPPGNPNELPDRLIEI